MDGTEWLASGFERHRFSSAPQLQGQNEPSTASVHAAIAASIVTAASTGAGTIAA